MPPTTDPIETPPAKSAAFGVLHYGVAALVGGHGGCLALLMMEAGSKWGIVLGALAGFAEGALGMFLWKAQLFELAWLVRSVAAAWMFVRRPRTLMGHGQDFVVVTNLAWIPLIGAGIAIFVFWSL